MPKESRQPCRYEYITRCLLCLLGFRRDAVVFLVSRRVVLFGVRFDDDDDEIFDAQSANFLLG